MNSARTSKTYWLVYSLIIVSVTTAMILTVLVRARAVTERGQWQNRADIPNPVYGHASAALAGKVHLLGGCETSWERPLSRHQIYDVSTDTWSIRADLPLAVGWAMPAIHNGKIYLFGGGYHEPGVGLTATDKAWVYDPETNSWSDIQPLPEPRMNGCAVTIGGYIYLAMGYDRRGSRDQDVGEEYTSAYRYDPANDAYTKVADSPHTGCYIAAGEHDGKLFAVVGTYHEATAMQDRGLAEDALLYDPVENVWERIEATRVLKRVFYQTQCSASAMYDGKLYIIGGVSEQGRTSITSYFDVRAKEFVRGHDLPEGRCCGGGAIIDGTLILAGGFFGATTDELALPTWGLGLNLLDE